MSELLGATRDVALLRLAATNDRPHRWLCRAEPRAILCHWLSLCAKREGNSKPSSLDDDWRIFGCCGPNP